MTHHAVAETNTVTLRHRLLMTRRGIFDSALMFAAIVAPDAGVLEHSCHVSKHYGIRHEAEKRWRWGKGRGWTAGTDSCKNRKRSKTLPKTPSHEQRG